ncbi:methyl-accepting chemotaxis protein [Pseudomonas segetis]|uniref:Methyl-accepting chemotaxis protein n=1 Tax=Pseudomonas segetis TaxID=298908 RepID=A0A239DU37_9PSED|nr:methyl-accepting chemotaxis protein [Pseudomonas segetis]SNS36125.1 methyl-accepting chemotaxis protein [Pseudomonas segetis]
MILRRLKLAPRSVICFGFFCLIIVAIGLLSLYQANKLNDFEMYVEVNVLSSIRIVGEVGEEFARIRANNARLRNPIEPKARTTKALNDIKQARVRISGLMKSLLPFVTTAGGREAYDAFVKTRDAYTVVQDRYLATIEAGQLEAAVDLSSSEMRQAAQKVQSALDGLTKVNQEKARQAGIEADVIYLQAQIMVWVSIAIGFAATVILALLYTRSLTVPIGYSLVIAERIAANDLSQQITVDGSDEPARLIAALATMQAKLREALATISDSSTQLAATSEEMHAVTEGAAQTIQRQGHEIEMAATAVNEMSAAVEEVASNASSTSQMTSQSSDAAAAGKAQVDETVSAINLVVSNVEATSSEVQSLVVMATDISKVLDVIRAIAEQTNLLALNAAIEAARAGEAGRGFAVVADEVRALAHRTQQSTHEIEQMVSSIQTGTSNAVLSMSQTNAQAQKTLEMAHSAGRALVDITESLTQINERNFMIATAAEEQAQVAREVDRNLVSIRDFSGETSEGASQTALATAELSTLATGLNQLTKQFKI